MEGVLTLNVIVLRTLSSNFKTIINIGYDYYYSDIHQQGK